jgi:pimeloyl-ACP methyl ester carboxylesterase
MRSAPRFTASPGLLGAPRRIGHAGAIPVHRDAMPQVDANGLRFEYESFGRDCDPAVVLVMGLGMQLTAWPEPFCQRIAEDGFRVIRFDNRDIGLSSPIPATHRPNVPLQALRWLLHRPVRSEYTIDDMARDTVGVLDALGIERAHLVGASMGGMIAQNVASSFPDRARSLVSIMSSSGARSLPMAHPRVLRMMLARPPKHAAFDALLAHYVTLFRALGGPVHRASDAELRARLERSLRRSFRPDGTLRQLLAVVASGDRSERLRAIRTPTCVIHGDGDPLLPLKHGRDCAAKIPGAKLEVIPGMGHDLPASLLPLLGDAVLAHLRRVEARA